MAKFPKLSEAILAELDTISEGRPLDVGLVISRRFRSAIPLCNTGHRLLVVGDRFRPLYRLWKKRDRASAKNLLVEAPFAQPPIAPTSLDVLIVARKLPRGELVRTHLHQLKHLVKPGGTLMWIHSYKPGRLGKKPTDGRKRLSQRHELCRVSMESGLAGVGQQMIREHRRPIALTVGKIPTANLAESAFFPSADEQREAQ